MLGALAALAAMSADASVLDFAYRAWKSTPEMRIEDAYKWIFHATLGGEHALRDAHGPRLRLEAEWGSLADPLPAEEEIVALRADGEVVRVNLRPYRKRGGDREMLFALFMASAQRFRPDRRSFERCWSALGARLELRRHGKIDFVSWKGLDARLRQRGFPAIHHSVAYERAYRPAYRVILGEMWAGVGADSWRPRRDSNPRRPP